MDVILDKNANEFIKNDIKDFYDKNIYRIYNDIYHSLYNDKERNSRSELELDIFENEIIKILEKDEQKYSKNEKELLELYKNFILKYLNQYKEIFITSKLINNDILCRKLFKGEFNKIKEHSKHYETVAMNLFRKFINHEKISIMEEKTLFRYFTSKIYTTNDDMLSYQKALVSEILVRKQIDLTGKEFLIKYFTNQKCKKLGLVEAKTYIGNVTPFNSAMGTNYGVSLGETGIICFNEKILRLSGVINDETFKLTNNALLIHVINHELEHYKDSIDYEKGKFTIGGWEMTKNRILRKYLSSDEFNEYRVNYHYKETERKANKVGYRETREIIEKYLSPKVAMEDLEQLIKLERETIFGEAESLQKGQMNGVNYYTTMEKYNINNLTSIIRKHPELVNQRPVLRLFFNNDGNLKKPGIILKEYTSILLNENISNTEKKEYKEIYVEIFDYIFESVDLRLFNTYISNFTDEEKIVWFKEIREAYARECRKIKNMMDIYQPNKNKQFDFIVEKRINKVRKYYDYIMENKNLIPYLVESNANRKKRIYPILELDEHSLNLDVASFQDRINYWNSEVTVNSSLANEISWLSDIGMFNSYSSSKKIY